MPTVINDPQHGRFRADEARSRAGQMTDPAAKQITLDIAIGYRRLAEEAEKRPLGPAAASN